MTVSVKCGWLRRGNETSKVWTYTKICGGDKGNGNGECPLIGKEMSGLTVGGHRKRIASSCQDF